MWSYIESDFQREYHIDLTTVDFSWRRFIALLSGLSAEGAFFTMYKEHAKRTKEAISGAENIAHHLAMQMSRKRKG